MKHAVGSFPCAVEHTVLPETTGDVGQVGADVRTPRFWCDRRRRAISRPYSGQWPVLIEIAIIGVDHAVYQIRL